MARPPAHLDAALEQLTSSLAQVEGRPVDPLVAPWPEVESGVIKLLRGAYLADRPEHQLVALGLAAAFGQRLAASDGAFWFPMRESPEGVMLGFPDALLMLSPFASVTDALGRAKLARLDEVARDIHRALGEARFAPAAGAPLRLSPQDYARLFDPAFLQLARLDRRRLDELWAARPDQLARDLRDALTRAGGRLAPESRAQLEQQLLGSLGRLEPARSLGEQVERAPRLAELLADLFAGVQHTGSAPDEFWEDAVLPLLFTGAPESFPPLDAEEVRAAQQGADPLLLFLDTVPYRQPAPDNAVLGVFDVEQVGPLHPRLGLGGAPRMLSVPRGTLEKLLSGFEPRAVASALERFAAYLSAKAGKPVQASEAGKQMQDAALALLGELQATVSTDGAGSVLVLRRLTEAEALSDAALAPLRQALQGPRIILAP
ncbi:MAG TPA: hypothetical protein VEJ89_14515 [Myxococcaceae bacterium]|nr:hypothetical protein [Myxococcaceae bacterium]